MEKYLCKSRFIVIFFYVKKSINTTSINRYLLICALNGKKIRWALAFTHTHTHTHKD